MRLPSTAKLLEVWERGEWQTPPRRALSLLAAACPDTPPESLAQLSLGERDARLLTLREWAFGSQLAGLTQCPNCDERLELDLNVAELRIKSEGEPAEDFRLQAAGYDVRFRLPRSLDVLEIVDSENTEAAERQLLARCLLSAQHGDRRVAAEELPIEVTEAIAAHLAEADPQADLQIMLSCPQCSHAWQMAFDIVSFFWSELHAWALHVLREVHRLASAYGWREADILALSARRRQFYLELIGA